MGTLWLCLCIQAPTDNACRVTSVPAQWPPLYEDTHGGNFYPSRLTWKDLREQLMCNCLSLKKKDKALVSLMKICTGIHLELHSQLTLNVCGLKRHAPTLLACNILLKVFKIIFHKSMIYECLKLSWLNWCLYQ